MKQVEEMFRSPESTSFQLTHPREVSDADEFTDNLWQRIFLPRKL